MLDFIFNDWLVGFGVPILIGVGFTLLADEFKEYKAARWCFWISGLWICGRVLMWSAVSSNGFRVRAAIVFLASGIVGVALMQAIRMANKRERSVAEATNSGSKSNETPPSWPAPPKRGLPSFLFVFGAPLGENDSPVWIMMLKHYGPNVVSNCYVEFFDNDRKNIEHQWLVEHPNSSFLPSEGVAGKSQARFHIPASGPEGPIDNFQWSPVDPNSQHYTVSITCPDGVFVENWEVTRVNGVLRTKITIEHGPQWVEKNPTVSPVVFTCTEPGFVSTPLASVLPVRKQQPVNPGWKPNHRFEFPVAIVDPNGHIQAMSGVKLPDGGQRTDFGCSNMLIKHFGDK